jgi:peroxiredoxin family protein
VKQNGAINTKHMLVHAYTTHIYSTIFLANKEVAVFHPQQQLRRLKLKSEHHIHLTKNKIKNEPIGIRNLDG